MDIENFLNQQMYNGEDTYAFFHFSRLTAMGQQGQRIK